MLPRREIPDADRLLVVFSDIEMGSGGPEDDFPHTDVLAELILGYNERPYAELDIDLVFNGDTFDLLKTDVEGAYPCHITEKVALAKLAQVSAAHPAFFAALNQFCEHRRAERQVFFVTGNHDAELCYPAVQRQIKEQCGFRTPVGFAGLELDIGRVHIEHGAQRDPLFRVDPARPLVTFQGEQVLNIGWGASVLLDTVMPLRSLLAFHERLKPRGYPFQLMPELRELMLSRMWRYWTRDLWRGVFVGDPTKKINWSIVKEVISRVASQDVDVTMDSHFLELMRTDDRYLLYLVGHQHDAGWWSFGDRKVLQAGCMRDEYMLSRDGHAMRPIPKCYAEVYMRGELPVISHLVELEFPPPPPGHIPDSIFDVLPRVRELLGSRAERVRSWASQQAQERRESRDDLDH